MHPVTYLADNQNKICSLDWLRLLSYTHHQKGYLHFGKKDFQKAFSIFVKNDFDCFINNRYEGFSFTEYLDNFFEVILKASILYHELYYETYGYLD